MMPAAVAPIPSEYIGLVLIPDTAILNGVGGMMNRAFSPVMLTFAPVSNIKVCELNCLMLEICASSALKRLSSKYKPL